MGEVNMAQYLIGVLVVPLQVWTLKKLFDLEAKLRQLEERTQWLMKFVNGDGA